MNLVEFLLARIAEDEEVARAAILPQYGQTGEWVTFDDREHLAQSVVFARNGVDRLGQACDTGMSWIGLTARDHIARHDPARVLAECEAKRRIVEQSQVLSRHGAGRVVAPELRWVLATLALPYAGHPDFDEDWRP